MHALCASLEGQVSNGISLTESKGMCIRISTEWFLDMKFDIFDIIGGLANFHKGGRVACQFKVGG